MDNIVIAKLTKEQFKNLQEMVNNGWATDFEKSMYFQCYGLTEQDQKESVKSFI